MGCRRVVLEGGGVRGEEGVLFRCGALVGLGVVGVVGSFSSRRALERWRRARVVVMGIDGETEARDFVGV